MLADGICKANPAVAATPRDCHDLLKNHAVALNENISAVARYCTEDFRTRLLGLY